MRGVFATCAALVALVGMAMAQDALPSVWDGVYTDAQAQSGAQVSAAECARCHGDTLTGGEAAPALAGYVFNATWEGVPLSDLFDRIRTSMPADNPGSLSRRQTADVLAFMLKTGEFPSGDRPLASDAGVLAGIRFLSFRPQP